MTSYETLLVSRRGPVGWLEFNRPDAANAMDARMMHELEDAWRELDADPDVRVIVNTGVGAAFQTGVDVAQMSRDRDALREQSRRTKRFELRFTAWHNGVTKPVIAAVNGVCAGGGLHFVADADIVIAAANATFLDPHVSVGQASVYETIAIAKKSAMEPVLRMAFLGRHERMPARRAYQLGIVSEVVDPPERLREVAQDLAARIARQPADELAAVKQALWNELEEDTVKYPELDTLKLERRGPVGWLLNNRPDQLNAMSAHMRDEFEIAWRTLDADPEVRVIVHSGEGRAFQTGVDVTEIASDGEGMQRYRESVEKFDFHFTVWHNEVWKPVITAVNGICAGGGFHWIADSDIVIAASDAEFFDPHVSIGQVVSIEAIGLMKRMPVEAVMRMAFVGRHERMSAQRAYELGMVSEVVDPPERLRDAAEELAEKIARNSPAAMAATKRALWGALELGLTDACKAGSRELVGMWGHPDQEEGPRAFAEKREPQWQPLEGEKQP